MTTNANKQIGDYEILEELGAGGMGRVYRVRNVISDRVEAMKVLLPDLAGRQELAARFLREIKLLASLDHPNIAALRTAFTADNQLIMIMEYIEGTSLAGRIERGPIAVVETVDYMDQVLSALSYAHQRNVIHRDIKPANMMLTPQGVVKLMDFGIARSGEDRSLTMTGATVGSISYMSPEQVKGEATDPRSDLYSVGISLYEMVTGQLPFRADSDYAIMAAQVKDAPKPPIELQPGLPAALNEIILTAIAKEPARRFQSADAFRNALGSLRSVSTARSTSSSRQATVVDTSLAAALTKDTNAAAAPVINPSPSQHARTMLDTKSQPQLSTPAKTGTIPPVNAPPPPPVSSHRGVYVLLGALLVIGALAGATVYVNYGRHGKLEASPDRDSKATDVRPIQAPKPLPPVPAPSKAAVEPAMPEVPVKSEPKKSQVAAMHQTGTGMKQESEVEKDTPHPAVPQNTAELDAVEHQVDQLSARSAAVNSGLDTLRQQQQAAGYGLRGDMAARQESMKLNISKAQEAVEHGDTVRAQRYMGLAEADVEALEHFLGR